VPNLADILAAGVRRDDLYVENGVSGVRASRLNFDRLEAVTLSSSILWTEWGDRRRICLLRRRVPRPWRRPSPTELT